MNLVHQAVHLLLLLKGFAQSAPIDIDHESSAALHDLLMGEALPIEEYEAKHIASGGKPFLQKLRQEMDEDKQPAFMDVDTTDGRDLGNNNNNYGNNKKYYDDDNNDDYFSSDSLSLSGYSLKYATCQKVQRFSADAIERGEYSSMVTDNIVVLRLCSSRSCNTNSQYGCNSNYGEYAMDVSKYMQIIMKYEHDKQQNFCYFCSSCYAIFGSYSTNSSDYGGNSGSSNKCYTNAEQCQSIESLCDNDDDSFYNGTNYRSYQDYFGCQKKAYNGNYFWVSPYCDDNNGIAMGVFYDKYCGQDAGGDVDVANYLGSDFSEEVFSSVQKIDCIDCSTSKYPPYYNSHNLLCSNIYKHSGQCDDQLTYDIGGIYYGGDDLYGTDTTSDDQTQCAFIESIRRGTYDTSGEIYLNSSQQISQNTEVTALQIVMIGFASMICVTLAVYSCFLHHSMTNLLLKSLSNGLVKNKRRRRYRVQSESSEDFTVDSGASSFA